MEYGYAAVNSSYHEFISYLEGCLKNIDAIDPIELRRKIRALKQAYRTARGSDQLGYIKTSIEGVELGLSPNISTPPIWKRVKFL